MAVLKGVKAALGDKVCLHRCLEHTKRNIIKAAKDPVKGGKQRLQRQELLSYIIMWVEFSAWLPSDQEFDAFWQSISRRTMAEKAATDWNEPNMAAYSRDHILDCVSDM